MDPDAIFELMMSRMGPYGMGETMRSAGLNPALMGPAMDAAGIPYKSPEEIAALFAGGGQIGPALMGEGLPTGIPGSVMGPGGQAPPMYGPGGPQMSAAGPQAYMTPPQQGGQFPGAPQLAFPVPPQGGGAVAPGMGVAAASNVVPQSRMAGQAPAGGKAGPGADYKTSGGVPGTPKPNEGLGVKAVGPTPAQAFLQAMLGSRGGANPLRVPPLGTMWG